MHFSKDTVNLNFILGNLTEYDNKLYLSTLNNKQKNELINSLDESFYQKCNDKSTCTASFIFIYIDIKLNLGIQSDEILKGKEIIVSSLYSELPRNLTGQEKGFVIPFLTNLCKVGFLNESEKVFWGKELIKLSRSYKSIVYFNECLRINTVTDLKGTYSGDSINTCNRLPTVDVGDICTLFVNSKILIFCEDPHLKLGNSIDFYNEYQVNLYLSKEYKSFYENNCKNKLSELYKINA